MATWIGALALCFGCAHVGPKSIPVDRFDYSTAVADSWKKQTLLNIVKLRYMDLPVFIEVSSMVAGYSLETSGGFGGEISRDSGSTGKLLSVNGSATFTDRPTITYVPLTGEKFLRGLIAPIDPKNIFFLIQTGYAADFVLGLTVDSLNGVRNRVMTGGVAQEAEPEFLRALELLREVQIAGAVGMRVEVDKAKGSTAVLFFRRDDLPPALRQKSVEIRRLLKLSEDQQKFELVYSPMRGADHELAVNSRSMLQILNAFSSHMDVPEAHLRERSAVPAFEGVAPEMRRDRVRIHSGPEPPAHSFVAVPYRDHWFWIENGDLYTKRALAAVMLFFTLADTGAKENLPLITIPAQ